MLTSDQVQFSLLYRKHEKEGLLAKAKELGVSVIAYSPLSQGLLTGETAAIELPSDGIFSNRLRNFQKERQNGTTRIIMFCSVVLFWGLCLTKGCTGKIMCYMKKKPAS